MAAPKTLSFLNLVMVALNFLWIACLENGLLFSFSFTDTIAFYPSYLTPAKFAYQIWNFIAFNMVLATYMMYVGTQKNSLNENVVKKVQKIDYLLILNQMALGLSMTLKQNDYFYWSLLYSIICLISVMLINKRIQIQRLTTNSFTRYFIRLGFGVFTGWLMFVIGFNFAVILVKLSPSIGDPLFFYLNLFALAITCACMLAYSYYNYLPSVSAVLAWGSYGAYVENKQDPLPTQYDILPFLIISMILGLIFTAFNYYRCTVRRKMLSITIQEPPSIT